MGLCFGVYSSLLGRVEDLSRVVLLCTQSLRLFGQGLYRLFQRMLLYPCLLVLLLYLVALCLYKGNLML